MKQKILGIIMLVVMALSVLALSSCERLEVLFPGGEVTDNHFKNVDMPLVYEIYLDYMEDIGEEPLSYDEWFEAIHGDEFQEGIIPLIEKNENSGFWEISFNNGKGWNDLQFKTENEEQRKCDHTFGKWITISEGNDYFNGIRYRECKKCDYKDYQFKIDKDAPSHTHSFTTTTTDPTCEAGGFDTKTCSCGYTEKVNETAPLGHEYTDEYVSDATYHWKKCVRCDYTTAKEEHTAGNDGKCEVCKCEMNCTSNEYFIFTLLDDDTYSVRAKNVNNMPNNVIIPSTYNGKSVTFIENNAFMCCSNLFSVTIPNSVTYIGHQAFYMCSNITNITIPDSIVTINDYAFSWCHGLTSIVIPDSVEFIYGEAFAYCKNLVNITIPDNVTYIGHQALAFCDNLTDIIIDENNQYYKSIDGNLYSKDGTTLIQYAIGKKDYTFEVPHGVTTIGRESFTYCDALTDIMISDNVTTISYRAFADCDNLTSVVIPSNVTTIEQEAFADCDSLSNIVISTRDITIGMFAFYNTAYYNNENNWIDGALYIGNHLINADTSISGDYIVKDGTITIAEFAFHNCDKITSVIIPNSVASIGSYAFRNCSNLTNVVIGDNVTSIHEYAFADCSSLTKIVIPHSVTFISAFVFTNCNNLTDVYYTGTEEEWAEISIYGANEYLTGATIHYNYVPEE